MSFWNSTACFSIESGSLSVVLSPDEETAGAKIASACPEKLGCCSQSCYGLTQARGRYAHWARTHLHREALREVSRCRYAALDRMLHRPTETYVGDPEHCREMDDSPDDPSVANAWDSGILGGIARAGFSHRENALPDPLNY